MKLAAALLTFVALMLAAQATRAADSPQVEWFRKDFAEQVKAAGHDPKLCTLEVVVDEGEMHLVAASCTDMSHACVVQVHPSLPMSRPVECKPNPEYKAPSNT